MSIDWVTACFKQFIECVDRLIQRETRLTHLPVRTHTHKKGSENTAARKSSLFLAILNKNTWNFIIDRVTVCFTQFIECVDRRIQRETRLTHLPVRTHTHKKASESTTARKCSLFLAILNKNTWNFSIERVSACFTHFIECVDRLIQRETRLTHLLVRTHTHKKASESTTARKSSLFLAILNKNTWNFSIDRVTVCFTQFIECVDRLIQRETRLTHLPVRTHTHKKASESTTARKCSLFLAILNKNTWNFSIDRVSACFTQFIECVDRLIQRETRLTHLPVRTHTHKKASESTTAR
ncbi:MAG: hypothetical protein ACRDBZ_16075, partial [Citrobacter braakii]